MSSESVKQRLPLYVIKNFFLPFSDTLCVSTLSVEGFTCREPPSPSTSIVVSFTGTTAVSFLNDLVQGYIERLLVSEKKNKTKTKPAIPCVYIYSSDMSNITLPTRTLNRQRMDKGTHTKKGGSLRSYNKPAR